MTAPFNNNARWVEPDGKLTRNAQVFLRDLLESLGATEVVLVQFSNQFGSLLMSGADGGSEDSMMVPGPRGEQGPIGPAGPALFMLADDNDDSMMYPPGPVKGTAGAAAALSGGGGTTITDTDTFDGYTLQQLVRALRVNGVLT